MCSFAVLDIVASFVPLLLFLGTAELVEEAARENNCKFTEHYVNGPHLLHVTHPEEITPVLLANMQSGNS